MSRLSACRYSSNSSKALWPAASWSLTICSRASWRTHQLTTRLTQRLRTMVSATPTISAELTR